MLGLKITSWGEAIQLVGVKSKLKTSQNLDYSDFAAYGTSNSTSQRQHIADRYIKKKRKPEFLLQFLATQLANVY